MFFGDAFAGSFFQPVRHASAAGRADSGVGARFRRPIPRGRAGGGHGRARAGPSAGRRTADSVDTTSGGPRRDSDSGGAGRRGDAVGRRGGDAAGRRTAAGASGPRGADDRRPAAAAAGRRPRALRRAGGYFRTAVEGTTRRRGAKQLQQLQSQVEPPLYRETEQLAAAVESLPPTARLPLVDLAMPAIKRSSPQQYAAVPRGGQRADQRRRPGRFVRVLSADDAVQLSGRSLRTEEAAGGALPHGGRGGRGR